MQLKDGEEVVVSYVTFRDRAHRDAVMAAAMQHKGFMAMMNDAPFDGKRMIWAGFEQFVNV